MKVYAISDLHLSINNPKPMDIFGGNWTNYWEKIKSDWNAKVTEKDIVLISGDISWGISLEGALPDFTEIAQLPGRKIIIKGNHDYWWSSYSKVKQSLPQSMYAIQNNAIELDNVIITGTRGWTVTSDKSNEQDIKIYKRELIRLQLSLNEAVKLAKKEGNIDKPIILMLHYPPFNALWHDSEFTDMIKTYPVNAVVYGHLHGSDCRVKSVICKDKIPYYITSCDLVNNTLQLIMDTDNQKDNKSTH